MAVWPPLFAFDAWFSRLHSFKHARCALSAGALLFIAPIAQAAEELRIAVAAPLSGTHAALGHGIKAAVEMAIADLIARDGTQGIQITVEWQDDRCSSDGGLAAAKAITGDTANRPAAVIGHACPSAAHAAAAVYNDAGLLNLTAGALPGRAPSTQRFGARHFRLPGEGSIGGVIGAALANLGPDARIAFVRDRTQNAQATLQQAAATLTARGRASALVETFAGAEKDFSALAQRIKASGITHIALAAYPSEAALLVAEIRKVSPDVTIFATDLLADAGFGRSARTAADGIRVALAPDADAFPLAESVRARLQSKVDAASRAAIASYAAIQVIADAAAARSSTTEDLVATLSSRTFSTILGPVSFSATGAASVPSHVFYTWVDGKLLPPGP